MISTGAFTVFALGLRHGADPDHLAAIDNMTRNCVRRTPLLSRFVGSMFAGGHSIMVLTIAALLGYLGSRFSPYSQTIETAGTVMSIVVLVLIALLNLRQLAAGKTEVAGAKAALIPAALRSATSPWVALPVGFLFGLGFESSSQVAAYAIAFGVDAGVTGALLIGSMFCAGMACTDTLDSLFVHKLVTYRTSAAPPLMRTWIWCVTLFALGVAGYEGAQLAGWTSPVPDIAVSGVLVVALIAVFAWIYLSLRRLVPDRIGDA